MLMDEQGNQNASRPQAESFKKVLTPTITAEEVKQYHAENNTMVHERSAPETQSATTIDPGSIYPTPNNSPTPASAHSTESTKSLDSQPSQKKLSVGIIIVSLLLLALCGYNAYVLNSAGYLLKPYASTLLLLVTIIFGLGIISLKKIFRTGLMIVCVIAIVWLAQGMVRSLYWHAEIKNTQEQQDAGLEEFRRKNNITPKESTTSADTSDTATDKLNDSFQKSYIKTGISISIYLSTIIYLSMPSIKTRFH